MIATTARWLRRQAAPGALDEPGAVVLAGAAGLGALVAAPVPVAVAVPVGLAALASRRVLAVWLAAALLTTALSAQAWGGLGGLEPGPFDGEVTLARDPERAFGAWRAEVVAGDRRLEAWARGPAGGALSQRAAGQVLHVSGRVAPVEGAPWLHARHVAGRLTVEEVHGWGEGGALARAANAVRGVLVRGAEVLPAERRALFLGFVLGDDRGQSPVEADDFEAAGLTHLLTVSGQNVAFLLAVAAPLLRRLRLTGRFVATVALLAFFATLTRFEPSVLRATVMAGLAALGVALGRPATGVRVLALAVAALVVADPFLVHSVGFRLSVAASAGILVLARPLADAVPGPRPLVLPLAVTVAAQVGVAPVLVPTFGPMPLAAVPANLLAEPVAGLVMMWGCSAGLVAGVLGGPVAALVHLPTGMGLAWVSGVARWAADLPLGQLGAGALVVAVGAAWFAVAARRRGRSRLALGAALVLLAAVVVPATSAGAPPPVGRSEVAGAELWVARPGGGSAPPASVLVLDGTTSAGPLLAGLREQGVARVDLVVARSGGSTAAATVAAMREQVEVGRVWAPVDHQVDGADVPAPGVTALGALRLEVTATSPRLELAVTGPG